MKIDKRDYELEEELSEADFRFAQRMRIIAIVLFMVISVLMVSCMKKEPEGATDYAFYTKDGEIFYTQLSSIEPKQLSENLSDSNDSIEWHNATFNTAMVNDMVIFPDYMKEDSGTIDLYYRTLSDPNAQNQKLAEKSYIRELVPETSVVYYEKETDDDIELYEWDFEKSVLVTKNPKNILYAKDGKSIVFLDDKGLFLKQAGKEKQQLDSDVAFLYFANSDLSCIIYMKNDYSLYKISNGTAQIIAEDTYCILFYEAGDGYYLTRKEGPKLVDLVEDDVPGEKSKDILRKEIRESKKDAINNFDLWYYDGEKSTKMDENFVFWEYSKPQYDLSGYPLPKKSGLIFASYNAKNFGKIKLSEVDSLQMLESETYRRLHQTADIYAARKASMRLANEVKDCEVYVDDAGRCIDLYKNPDFEKFTGDLYRMNFEEDTVEETQFVAERVMMGSAFKDIGGYEGYILQSEKVYEGDLYVDGKKVDEKVDYVRGYLPNTKNHLLYMSDVSKDNLAGTLKLYRDGKIITIDEHVDQVIALKSALLYLKNENPSVNEGTLYYFDGEKSHRIDGNVSSVAWLNNFYK